jgi:hypothetical protein
LYAGKEAEEKSSFHQTAYSDSEYGTLKVINIHGSII